MFAVVSCVEAPWIQKAVRAEASHAMWLSARLVHRGICNCHGRHQGSSTSGVARIVGKDKMYIRLQAHIDLLLNRRNAFQSLDACLQFLLPVFTILLDPFTGVILAILDL